MDSLRSARPESKSEDRLFEIPELYFRAGGRASRTPFREAGEKGPPKSD